jgi:hypothetical protein
LEGLSFSSLINRPLPLLFLFKTENIRYPSFKTCLEAAAGEEAATPQLSPKLSMSLEFEAGTFGKLILEKRGDEIESAKAHTKILAVITGGI